MLIGCRRVKALLDEYLDGAIAPGRRRWVERHTSSCSGCAAELHARRGQFELLESLQRFAPPEGFSARVMQRVRALRRQPAARPERARVWGWLTAASAAALLAVGVWMAGRVNHPQQPPAASQISVASVYRSQGATLESEGRFDEALDAYEKAVRQENSRLATLDKGRVLDKMGYQVAAAETYIDFASSSLD